MPALLVVDDEPGPAAAELPGGGLGEVLLEAFEPPEIRLEHVRELALRLAAAFRRHALPIEGVVPRLRGGVEGTGQRRILRRLRDQRVELHLGELLALDRLVQLVDVALVVLAVVEADRLRADVRIERVLLVGERRQLERAVGRGGGGRLLRGLGFALGLLTRRGLCHGFRSEDHGRTGDEAAAREGGGCGLLVHDRDPFCTFVLVMGEGSTSRATVSDLTVPRSMYLHRRNVLLSRPSLADGGARGSSLVR